MDSPAWVVFTAGASILAILSPTETELDIIAFIGIFLWWSGFLIEVIADNQKRKFRETSDPKTEFITIFPGQDLVISTILRSRFGLVWLYFSKFFIWNWSM